VPSLNCAQGTVEIDGQCVVANPLTCAPGTVEIEGQCVPATTLNCGPGTIEVDGACVPSSTLNCAPGTVEVNGECVSTNLQPGNYLSPIIQTSDLRGVGSHSDENKIYPDGKLINCSYSFDIINASDATRLRNITPLGGVKHVIGADTRRPGCKHFTRSGGGAGNLVFTTHFGNINNPPFLSGWDITTPAAPVQLPFLQEPGISYEGIDMDANGNIYVGLHDNGLGVYNFQPGVGFTRIGSLGGFIKAHGVTVRGSQVFVADGLGGFVTVDATDPTNPVMAGRVLTGGQGYFSVVNGNTAYVAAGSAGVAVVDFSDFQNPTILTKIEMPGTAIRVAFSDNRLFVAAWNDVRIYDVTTPAAPRFLAAVRIPREFNYNDPDREWPTGRIFSVAARGTDFFAAMWDHPFAFRLYPDRIAPNIRLGESSARLDFGQVAVGSSKNLEFEVTNQGTAPLTLTDNHILGATTMTVSPAQLRIDPGMTGKLTLTYRPVQIGAGEERGYLNLVSDDPAQPVRRAYVVGNPPGISVGQPLPATVATLLDGTVWNSSEALGSVVLLNYFATF
jgi:hypothetical protein